MNIIQQLEQEIQELRKENEEIRKILGELIKRNDAPR